MLSHPSKGVTLATKATTNTHKFMAQNLSEYFRIPNESLRSFQFDAPAGETGFFRFGPDIVCYGRCMSGRTSLSASDNLYDTSRDVRLEENTIQLPFDPAQVIANLRNERYTARHRSNGNGIFTQVFGRKAYYTVRDHLPDWFRRQLQRAYFGDWQRVPFPRWPVD